MFVSLQFMFYYSGYNDTCIVQLNARILDHNKLNI